MSGAGFEEGVSMPYDSDVIVVGGGAGGATLAYACARAGKSVLLLERGPRYLLNGHSADEQAMLIDKKPYDDRVVEVNGSPERLYMGGVLGGGTALYGAALMRPSQDDFHPGRHYGSRIPRAIWDWPITYGDLEPHYTEAEKLYGVSGRTDESFGPLEKPATEYPHQPLPLHPINQRLIAANRDRGLQPFRLPLAIDSDRCLRCHACAGYVCPNGSRRTSSQLADRAVTEGYPLQIQTFMEVEKLATNGAGKVDAVHARNRVTGDRAVFRARRYVLGAGAIGSPLLLLRSGIQAPLIGRHYMMHLSPIVVGIFARPTGGDTAFIKQVGFADYYHGTNTYSHKLGLVQSLPVPGPLMMAKTAPRFLPRSIQQFLRKRMLPLAGIVEDLPNPANAVSCGTDGQPRLKHQFADYDNERGRQLGRMMAKILKNAGALFCLSRPFPSSEHVAHQCGTLRFGTKPAQAVLDRDCRLFGHENTFAVDGSFFPTSLGVGPALTIIANALRVANVVTREL
jgi:choline dehydrogenase-like flavoprotein